MQYSHSLGEWPWVQPGLDLSCIWGPELFFMSVKVKKAGRKEVGRTLELQQGAVEQECGQPDSLAGKEYLDKKILLPSQCSFCKAGKPEMSWWCLKQSLVVLHREKSGRAHVSYSSEILKTVVLYLLSSFLLAVRWLVSHTWGYMKFLLLLMQSQVFHLLGGSNQYLRLLGMGLVQPAIMYLSRQEGVCLVK